ncbi:hypothetical protein [Leucobacter sp. G161]|uniref:hypothetical protein n=1 Tax=Leucobacter sp. G161 TaxID=663704 RepID=UPI00073C13F0|nr:hypothetical protein [Leucobacter sp. G161]KUF06002.1 hypothetical protein AUL38_15075 [Leucobacter sp. G161]
MHDIKNTLPIQLLHMRELLMVRFRAVFVQVNITDAQWRVIRVINDLGTVDFAELSELSSSRSPACRECSGASKAAESSSAR